MQRIWQTAISVSVALFVVIVALAAKDDSKDGSITLISPDGTKQDIKIDKEDLDIIRQKLADATGDLAYFGNPQDGFSIGQVCRVSEDCNKLFPGKPVFCKADTDEDVCKKAGKILKID